jgi:hypothetical protein
VQLEHLKEERDTERLAQQAKNLNAQLKRWQVSSKLTTSRKRRANPDARALAYERHALRQALAQTSRAVQAEALLRASVKWVDADELDAAINAALDSPKNIYKKVHPWKTDLPASTFVEGAPWEEDSDSDDSDSEGDGSPWGESVWDEPRRDRRRDETR